MVKIANVRCILLSSPYADADDPEIKECFLMTGGADYLLRVEVGNAGEFERIHKEILSKMPGVLRIHSSFAIRNVLATRTRTRS